MTPSLYFLLSAGLLIVGAVLGYLVRQNFAKRQLSTAEGQAAKMIEEAAVTVKEITLDAKNKAVEIFEEAKKNEQAREEKLLLQEQRIEKREEQAEKGVEQIDAEKRRLLQKAEEIRAIREESEKLRQEELKRLEALSELSKEEAQTKIFAWWKKQKALVKRMSKRRGKDTKSWKDVRSILWRRSSRNTLVRMCLNLQPRPWLSLRMKSRARLSARKAATSAHWKRKLVSNLLSMIRQKR
jgi:hypothetical protein